MSKIHLAICATLENRQSAVYYCDENESRDTYSDMVKCVDSIKERKLVCLYGSGDSAFIRFVTNQHAFLFVCNADQLNHDQFLEIILPKLSSANPPIVFLVRAPALYRTAMGDMVQGAFNL